MTVQIMVTKNTKMDENRENDEEKHKDNRQYYFKVKTRVVSSSIIMCEILTFRFGTYVVVQFYPWFKFYFPLFLGMVMYDNEFETTENKI